nr:glutathione S-transferase 3-like [Nothobranchius furzeri]
MSGKVSLHYFNGRGKMESIRWLLTVAEVEFDEFHLTTRDQYQKLLDGELVFRDILNLCQASLQFIAGSPSIQSITGRDVETGFQNKTKFRVN